MRSFKGSSPPGCPLFCIFQALLYPAEGGALTEAGAAGELAAPEGEEALSHDGCFVAGTLVQMANETTRGVEAVRKGDWVSSRNEKTGKTEPMPVLKTTVRRVASVVLVVLDDTSTGQTQNITATTEHPFYVAGKGFIGAGQLSSGNQVVSRYGPILEVKSVTEHHQPGGYLVYNLVVNSDHTYFVGKVDGGAWVHNVDCPPDCIELADQTIERLGGGTRVKISPQPGTGGLVPEVAPRPGIGRVDPPWLMHEVVEHEGMIHDPILSAGPVPEAEYWQNFWNEDNIWDRPY